ncbi:PREDICTED: retinol dehydrogenase 12-like [Nelumbo nucifera]|uniref:Retinol dehydrogenase 12-like n=1 Tax=Nelumbo nucifera TaxID=4432 RepID=A0A1U7YT64_NELNU|nr:PREDICTED: retinol dehydrogenase 12-like [Nelumbo nucifera]
MSSPSSSAYSPSEKQTKQGLGWMEWLRGWLYLVYEMLFQRIMASHLQNPLPLPPLNDLTCIVTGSTSGIGLEIARQLAESGAHVVMAVRKPKAAQELIQKWQNEWSGMGLPLNIEVMELDLLSLDSVVRFAEAWNACMGPLHVLINNAGIFSIGEPQRFSKDGYEEHMQVNHLAPALLSILLLPSLIRGSPSRIINVNSIMHYVGFVDTEDMNIVSGKRKYTSLAGYSNSKLAQIMFSSILHKKLPAEAGINVVCVSPGIVHTNVARDLPKIVQGAYHLIPYFIFSAREGSRSALFAATDPQVPEYCGVLKADEWPVCACISHDCRPMNASEEAHNLETSYKVWEKTLEMIGLPSDAVDKLLEGDVVECRYGAKRE